MHIRTFLWLFILSVATLGGCTDHERFVAKQDPTPLIDGISSYQSVEEFLTSFGSYETVEELTKSEGTERSNRRPPFRGRTLTVKEYTYLGFEGELIVNFYNDNLASVVFFPSNFDSFVDALSRQLKIEVKLNQEIPLPPHMISIYTDYRGKVYVKWSDQRLDALLKEWVRKLLEGFYSYRGYLWPREHLPIQVEM